MRVKCPFCGKVAQVTSVEKTLIGNLYTYACGHSVFSEKVLETESEYQSLDKSKSAYPYQIEGIEFVKSTNYNALIADAMGLGKTIQALLAIRNNKNLLPCLIVVKQSTLIQWIREIHDWFDNSALSVCPIIGAQAKIIPPGFSLYIVSMDSLGRNDFYKKFLPLGIKCVIVDECHSFKEMSAKRTKALISLIREGNIKHKIFLSGTPIKNRANEYFTVLNLLAPHYFPYLSKFEREWLLPDEKGVYSRVKPWRLEAFRELISEWVIRREKSEVLKDLPDLRKDYSWVRLEDPTIRDTYNSQLDLFANYLQTSQVNAMGLLAWLQRMRHLVALAKVPYAVEFIREFLEQNDGENIAIGIHHHSVKDLLAASLEDQNPIIFDGTMNQIAKDAALKDFEAGKSRILIISELAGGYGINLQFCANTLILERQWNYCDEEQFISRFHRNGQTKGVCATFLLAEGTIDEWFHDLVNRKKAIFGETIADWRFSEDFQSLRELAEITVSKKL